MNKPKENIKALIARIATIGLFVFTIFLYKSPESTITKVPNHIVVNMHAYNADDKAIPCLLASSPNLTNSIVSCEISTLNTCNNNSFRIISSNQKVDQLLKKCWQEFLEIKTLMPDFNSIHILSFSNREIPTIS